MRGLPPFSSRACPLSESVVPGLSLTPSLPGILSDSCHHRLPPFITLSWQLTVTLFPNIIYFHYFLYIFLTLQIPLESPLHLSLTHTFSRYISHTFLAQQCWNFSRHKIHLGWGQSLGVCLKNADSLATRDGSASVDSSIWNQHLKTSWERSSFRDSCRHYLTVVPFKPLIMLHDGSDNISVLF